MTFRDYRGEPVRSKNRGAATVCSPGERMIDALIHPIDAFALSSVGKARDRNEDSFVADLDRGLFLVADGMGGYGHGDVAARLAVDSIGGWISLAHSPTGPASASRKLPADLLRAGFARAHDALKATARSDLALLGMGTTVVALWLSGGIAALAHVGDSRAYRFTRGDLELLTEDHTWVREQIAAGKLSERQAREHPNHKLLTQALGRGAIAVDVTERVVLPGDLYLLCSDGLSSMLDDTEIASCLAEGGQPESLCRELAARANERGGFDDITAIVVRVGNGYETTA